MEDKDIYAIVSIQNDKISEIGKVLSEIKANQNNHLSYLEAVNSNSKEHRKELTDHIADDRNNFDFLKQSALRVEDIGKANAVALEGLKNSEAKIAKDFNDHASDDSAHGMRTRTRVWDTIWKTIGAVSAIAALVIGLYKFFKGGQ